MQMLPRNAIEAKHLEALHRFGHAAADWTFENQLPHYRSLCHDWTDAAELRLQKLSSWSPSRFELIELIPLYYFASENVKTMREMSTDTHGFRHVPFCVASDPSRRLTSYVEEHSSEISTESLEGSLRHVVWVNVGVVNFTKALAHHFVWTLVRDKGSLTALFDRIGQSQDALKLVAALVEDLRRRRFQDEVFQDHIRNAAYPRHSGRTTSWIVPRFGSIHELDKDVQTLIVVLANALVTFIIGHEMGHVYLGHTGFRERTQLVTSAPAAPFSEYLMCEVEADGVGLLSVWDGMANGTNGTRVPIDYTWVAPVFFLAGMLGLSMNMSNDSAQKWAWRLLLLVKGLTGSLRAAGFEPDRVRRVMSSAPAIAEAMARWIWLELSPDEEARKWPDLILFEQLASVCSQV